MFRNIFAKDEVKGRSFVLLSNTADDALNRSLAPLEADEHTKKVLSRLSAKLDSSKALRTMAVGPKSSGKSTFNRLLCNMITSKGGNSRCFYLEEDVVHGCAVQLELRGRQTRGSGRSVDRSLAVTWCTAPDVNKSVSISVRKDQAQFATIERGKGKSPLLEAVFASSRLTVRG